MIHASNIGVWSERCNFGEEDISGLREAPLLPVIHKTAILIKLLDFN
jgi:hypothetical protein